MKLTTTPSDPVLLKQRRALLAECEGRGWRELHEAEEIELGAEALERTGLRLAFDMVGRGASAGLAVTTFGPPAELMRDLGAILAAVQDDGWAVVGLDGCDIPESDLVRVWATFAPVAREFIARRTSAALARRKAAGARVGRPQQVADDVIQRILIARWSDQSLSAIAAELNDDGVPTATGRGPWQASTVRGVMHSERAKELTRAAEDFSLDASPTAHTGGAGGGAREVTP
jgi:DNA invertase Pin-like site-specific DNA recombinase